MLTADSVIAKSIKFIFREWKKTRPKKQKQRIYFAEDIGVSQSTVSRALEGRATKETIEMICHKLGYRYEWVTTHQPPKKVSEEEDKKGRYLELSILAADVERLRNDIYGEKMENTQLRKDMRYLQSQLEPLKLQVNDLERLVKKLNDQINDLSV